MSNKDRGFLVSKEEVSGSLDLERTNKPLDEHLEKPAPSTSREFDGKDNDRLLCLPRHQGSRLRSPEKQGFRCVGRIGNVISFGLFLPPLDKLMLVVGEREKGRGKKRERSEEPNGRVKELERETRSSQIWGRTQVFDWMIGPINWPSS